MSALNAILAVNAGSSSLKFALYPQDGRDIGAARLSGNIEGLEAGGSPNVKVSGRDGNSSDTLQAGDGCPHDRALAALDTVLKRHADGIRITAIAHRIVHGGERLTESVLLDDDMLAYLTSLSSLAPLHQPHNLAGVRAFRKSFPHLPQIGCFDTAFHATLPQTEYLFALPQSLREMGIRRYGFHGLSYRYVADRLMEHTAHARGRAVIAHLGNGASACAVKNGKSIATTMGFSALDGLMMGTRSGEVDPGVLLHLLRHGWSWEQLERMLYRESGLRGVSGVSADMRTLHASAEPAARLAIDIFIHRLVRECGALSACLEGLDVIAFTGGIGEHDAALRKRTCDALSYLGIRIDEAANQAANGDAIAAIHAADSSVEIWVVPTDEGRVAAQDAARLIN
ncbi:acetate/propionate family kinase [Noviherbaspirillum sp.]|jgi:acetate kinase|uniref:acetate/propionate family kinase n=1 Tax=Noviherbaspirillum sp. TaxID=1926288 RepID=UPI0025F056D9|nr:acetate/propionate family kinase [Noviherbaspirillum sp.]